MIAIWPVLLAGAQINRFQQARSPVGHQEEPPRQLDESAAGAVEQGAANHVRLFGESAPALGGQIDNEQGTDPNWHGAVQAEFSPAGKVGDEEEILPGWLESL